MSERAIMNALSYKLLSWSRRGRLRFGRERTTDALRDDRRGELHQWLARLAVGWIGKKRVNARRDEMIAVEGIGVCPVGERIAEAVQGKLRNHGSDETVDRIAVVAGD